MYTLHVGTESKKKKKKKPPALYVGTYLCIELLLLYTPVPTKENINKYIYKNIKSNKNYNCRAA